MLLYNRAWRHVPLPLAKDAMALLWHCGALSLWPDTAAPTAITPGARKEDLTVLDHKANIVFKVDVRL